MHDEGISRGGAPALELAQADAKFGVSLSGWVQETLKVKRATGKLDDFHDDLVLALERFEPILLCPVDLGLFHTVVAADH